MKRSSHFPPPTALLRSAAELLLEDATAEEESCMIGRRKWTCPDCQRDGDGKCQAQRNVEARRDVAARLAARVPKSEGGRRKAEG